MLLLEGKLEIGKGKVRSLFGGVGGGISGTVEEEGAGEPGAEVGRTDRTLLHQLGCIPTV